MLVRALLTLDVVAFTLLMLERFESDYSCWLSKPNVKFGWRRDCSFGVGGALSVPLATLGVRVGGAVAELYL
jgi:hypothetical protein